MIHKFAASLVIPTYNRVEELRALIQSARAQTVPLEVLVMDDGASDEVAGMIRGEFPGVQYHRLGTRRGPAFQRNRGIELSAAPVAFPLDDDAVFASPHTVEQTLAEFENPCIGAVAIPFMNVRFETHVRQQAPEKDRIWVEHAFVGASHAVLKTVFLELGGYREHFYYMGEEGDFCLRLLNSGYVVRLGTADPIHHLESPRRNLALADYSGRRNDVLFAWHNVPTLFLPLHLAGTTFNGLRSALRAQNPGRMVLGILHGYRESLRRWKERTPVSREVYRLQRMLKRSGPRALDEIKDSLPARVQPFKVR